MITKQEVLCLLLLITYTNGVAIRVTTAGSQITDSQIANDYILPKDQYTSKSNNSNHYTNTGNKKYTDIQQSTTQIPGDETTTMKAKYTNESKAITDTDNNSAKSTTDNYSKVSSSTSDLQQTDVSDQRYSKSNKSQVSKQFSNVSANSGDTSLPKYTKTLAKYFNQQRTLTRYAYINAVKLLFGIDKNKTRYTTSENASSSSNSTEEANAKKPITGTPSSEEDTTDKKDSEGMFTSIMPQSTIRPPLHDLDISNETEEQEEESETESDSDDSDSSDDSDESDESDDEKEEEEEEEDEKEDDN